MIAGCSVLIKIKHSNDEVSSFYADIKQYNAR